MLGERWQECAKKRAFLECPLLHGIKYLHRFLTRVDTLTPTERCIYDYYLEKKTTKEILELLNIKENTLKFHNKNIYSKLEVSSRKELISIAQKVHHFL